MPARNFESNLFWGWPLYFRCLHIDDLLDRHFFCLGYAKYRLNILPKFSLQKEQKFPDIEHEKFRSKKSRHTFISILESKLIVEMDTQGDISGCTSVTTCTFLVALKAKWYTVGFGLKFWFALFQMTNHNARMCIGIQNCGLWFQCEPNVLYRMQNSILVLPVPSTLCMKRCLTFNIENIIPSTRTRESPPGGKNIFFSKAVFNLIIVRNAIKFKPNVSWARNFYERQVVVNLNSSGRIFLRCALKISKMPKASTFYHHDFWHFCSNIFVRKSVELVGFPRFPSFPCANFIWTKNKIDSFSPLTPLLF